MKRIDRDSFSFARKERDRAAYKKMDKCAPDN
jgi:hypothetical protein